MTVGGSSRGANYFTGDLDELQVSNIARPAEWLQAAARSQGMVAPLLVYGGDSQKESGGGEGYFATTLRSVTFDGWVIIGILTIMFFWSVWIMIFKSIYLGARRERQRPLPRRVPQAARRPFGGGAALRRQAGNEGRDRPSRRVKRNTRSSALPRFTGSITTACAKC